MFEILERDPNEIASSIGETGNKTAQKKNIHAKSQITWKGAIPVGLR